MNDKIAMLIIYLIFIAISLVARKVMLMAKRMWLFLLIPSYLLLIGAYYNGVFYFVRDLDNRELISIDFGHADLGLFLLFILSCLTGLVFMGNIILIKNKGLSMTQKLIDIESNYSDSILIKPLPTETAIIGSWIYSKGKMTADDNCQRIAWLIDSYLKKTSTTDDGWTKIYQDPKDGRYWECTYPQGHMQGGGPPMLQIVSDEKISTGQTYKVSTS
ncbi:Imm27 family immunity protein [Mucilaginibacter sp.]|uniref:Imm27 family immunity protein n=1 Tax=Mucilaginibacter sp. TaxID=1882438 RepID=UPI002603B844|nr:Imm27 family immunity protein [Mucilaginibacter sp.]MDB4926711.1 hypothetical protein [Mucilaginibacter sp.]